MPATRSRLAIAVAAIVIGCQPSPPASVSPTATPVRELAVVVTAPEGAVVPGARVCVLTVGGREERCGETGASGTARLGVRPGAYALKVTPPAGSRFSPAQGWAEVLDRDATALIELAPRSTISGTVRDERGGGVAGAEVCAHPPRLAAPTCERTGAQGAYTIEVRSDVYKLDVTGPPGAKLIPQWAVGRLHSGEADILDVRTRDAKDVDVVLIRGVLLTGFVRGPSGPIENAQVCMRTLAAPLPWDCERTSKNGSYIALRETGRYYVWVIPPDRIRLVAQWYDGALVGVDATPLALDGDRAVDVTLEPGPQLHGTVRTTDGQPVTSALVCVDTPFPTGRICRGTDSDGRYSVTTRPETYVVQVFPPEWEDLMVEFWSRKRTWVEADRVSLGNADRVLDLTVRRGVRVTGFVRDSRGVPLEGATLNLHDDEGPLLGVATDVSGRYTAIVPPGRYEIEVFAPFRGERGDLLSLPLRELVVSGFTRHDIVLEDASP
jgi:hypothetical protein